MQSSEMIQKYYNSNCSSKVWVEFYNLCKSGKISRDEFSKFVHRCASWMYDESLGITDMLSGEVIVL